MTRAQLGEERIWLGAVIAVAVLAHFLLPLNTGLYWDDYMLVDWLIDANWARLYETGDTMGNLGYTYLYWPFHAFADPAAAMKIAVFVCLVLTAVMVYLAARETGLVDRLGAFFLAAASVVYPGHMMAVAVNIAGHFFCYLAFAVAAWCTLRSRNAQGPARYSYRVLAWAAFIVSFVTPSFLAFHFGFLVVLFLCSSRAGREPFFARVVRFLRSNYDLIILPFAYWLVHGQVNPVHGWAKDMGYNAIRLAPDQLLLVYRNLVTVVSSEWLEHLGLYLVWFGISLAVLALAWRRPSPVADVRRLRLKGGAAVALGILWLALAAFPYAAVGKGFGMPGIVDWETRNRLLLQLPLGIVILGAAGMLLAQWPRIRAAALVGALAASVALRIDAYAVWEAQAIKDESIRHHLLGNPAVRNYHLLVFHDRYQIVDPSWHGNDLVLWWSFALKLMLGDFTRFGVYDGDYERVQAARPYTATDIERLPVRDRVHPPHFDPALPQAAVLIEPGPRAGKEDIVLPYYVARLRGGAALSGFLSEVTRVTLVEIR